MARSVRWLRVVRVFLAVLLLGCGGGSKHARDPHQVEREQLDAARPKAPLETRERVAYRPGDRCGQGPYRLETDALRTQFAEQVVVYACGQHEISGNYRLTVEGRNHRSSSTDESAFGFGRRDNAACKANVATTTATSSGGGGSGARGGSGSSNAASAPTAAPATLASTALERVGDAPAECSSRIQVFDITYQSGGDDIALDGHMVIDIWSDEPNDLENLVFVIEKRVPSAGMTVDRWKAYLEADHIWYERYMAFIKGEVSAGRTTLIDSKVKTPPPPPPRPEAPPPKPSKNARWIAGYWHYEAPSFYWIAGLWQVPDEDIAKDLTVHAPTPPPEAPPPVAAQPPPEPRPAATAVWTPGQWQWDGRAYVWVTGAWRIPPSPQHSWQPAAWSITTRGVIFVPGGWHVRLRR